jgi:hypothetical protein
MTIVDDALTYADHSVFSNMLLLEVFMLNTLSKVIWDVHIEPRKVFFLRLTSFEKAYVIFTLIKTYQSQNELTFFLKLLDQLTSHNEEVKEF